jgi:hypothetical protein
MGDLAAFDDGAGAPAAAVDDLLVGEHRLVHRIPIDLGIFLVEKPLSEQPCEQPLLPAVILGPAGGELAVPVIGEAQLLELSPHVVDVLVGPLCRRDLVLHGGILRRQAECIPSHGLQDILTLHALIAADDIADGVVAHVTHVQASAGIGEHGQAIELLPVRVLGDSEHTGLFPMALNPGLDLLWKIPFVHGFVRVWSNRRRIQAPGMEQQIRRRRGRFRRRNRRSRSESGRRPGPGR